MKISSIKDIVLIVAVLVIIGLILFKKDPPNELHEKFMQESIQKIDELETKIDSMDVHSKLIFTHRDNEKTVVDSIIGVDAHDSILSAKFGFTSIK